MGLLDYLGLGKANGTEQANLTSNTMYEDDHGYFYQYMRFVNGLKGSKKFNPCFAFEFAYTVGEIYTPIDIIASRVSGLPYKVYKKGTDEEVEPSGNLERLLKTPNPWMNLNQLIYLTMFSNLSTGGSYLVSKQPDSLKTRSTDRIVNLFPLNPDQTKINLKKSIPNPFLIKKDSEVIDTYKTKWLIDVVLQPYEVTRQIYTHLNNEFKTVSPLLSVEQNINNLMAVYSARFNVYDKNGSAGIISPEKDDAALSEELNPETRQEILDDIQNRDGLTGMRNLVGISGKAVKWVETLAKIKDLEPFKETHADAIAIAGALEVDKELIPKESSTTFSNKESVERQLWQNIIIPNAKEQGKNLTKALYLTDLEIKPDFSDVAILKTDRKVDAEADKIELENLEKMEQMGITQNKLIEKWKS